MAGSPPRTASRPAPLLVRPAAPGPVPAVPRSAWETGARQALDHPGGFLRVLGGPGTGKTTLVAEIVADRVLRQHADPENVLVLTTSRRAAKALRAHITALLPTPGTPAGLRTSREPLVRTVHSYAFGVLRLQAALHGTPAPRLLSGPDQDAVVRELLTGDVDSGADNWPERLRPALRLPGFAAELRDLLLRAAERGLGPEDLIELGRRHGYDEWIAAGEFGRQYEEVTLLSGLTGASGGAPAMDAAELVSSALVQFDVDDELRAAEQARVRHLIVDDAQHLDPQQFDLVNLLGETAAECVLLGDPDQAIFSFRGADPRLLTDADPTGEATAYLHVDHRMAPEIRAAVGRLTARLPGTGHHRDLVGPESTPTEKTAEEAPNEEAPGYEPADEFPNDADDDQPPARVDVRLFASAAQEAAWIADQLRRAHLLHHVPWAEMAVVVRSGVRTLPVLRRALLGANVPIAVSADPVPLSRHPIVRPFLELIRLATSKDDLDEDTATVLLSGPLGGADALAQRRLRRGLRRLELAAGGSRTTGELLVEALDSGDALAALEPTEAAPVRRVAELLRVVRESVDSGDGIEQVLWKLWQSSGLERRLVAQSARGGPVGAQADRDLDAVLVLFDAAANYTDRLPGSGAAGFAEYLSAQQIVGDTLAPSAPHGDSVALLTAHASAGREWTVVAVPGVQEGSWPDLRLRGSLLGVERLVDLLSGIEESSTLSATAPLLAEERRLLRLATSRARRVLLVSAVRGEDEQPSRFLDELDGASTDPDATVRPVKPAERHLVLSDLVGELRRVACADAETEADQARRRRAARQLARLAAAGVPGADPRTWYGLPSVSVSTPLWTEDDEVRVSPSTVEILTRCPLRWFAERHGGTDPADLPSVTGSLVHALAQVAAEGATMEQLRAELDKVWATVDAGAPWYSRRERQRVEHMVEAFRAWLSLSRGELTQVAVEHGVDVRPDRKEGGPWLRVRGRVDRLEVDADGRPVVVDLKTGKNVPTRAEAEEHPQLAVYQVAAALGAFGTLGLRAEPGGARLVYLSKDDKATGAAQRAQPPLDEPAVANWLDVVGDAAAKCVGPEYTATQNSECPRCPARTSCPLHDDGRQVGQ